MLHEVIIAGFGGQGIMSMGQLLASAAMLEKKEVSWLPSYGPEMRGGTANCTVILSDNKIGSPIISSPNCTIVMNKPSLDKFKSLTAKNGLLIYNSSLIDAEIERTDLTIIAIPANDIANQIGNSKVANTVTLGAFIGATNAVHIDSVIKSLEKILPQNSEELLIQNKKALEKGKKVGCRL